jgi:hypothetical protein
MRTRWTPTTVIIMLGVVTVTLAGGRSVARAMDDRPVIDPAVRAMPQGGPVRVLVELRAPAADPSALDEAQNEVLRRLTGTNTRLARRYSTTPLLALEIDAAALARLEEMRGLVIRVRPDRISPPFEGAPPRR